MCRTGTRLALSNALLGCSLSGLAGRGEHDLLDSYFFNRLIVLNSRVAFCLPALLFHRDVIHLSVA